jgi:hypothetical protein
MKKVGMPISDLLVGKTLNLIYGDNEKSMRGCFQYLLNNMGVRFVS